MEEKHPAQKPENIAPSNPSEKYLPIDPSNTSNVGKKVDTGVVDVSKGLSEQSNEWEDQTDRKEVGESLLDDKAERYIKDPSPEEKETGSEVKKDDEKAKPIDEQQEKT